ncbi:MAG TPA: metallophosphoesterase [Gemmataceae bacterium]|jgi:calcineurin-like phosphoesterase family protein|nr:metallophosphoesterase [Gemmataceae bacterium]
MSNEANSTNSTETMVRASSTEENPRQKECIRVCDEPVIVVIPGDLHLTKAGIENHQTALWMVNEVNTLIRPDFVQFIGDNAQHAAEDEFLLFRDLCDRLEVPFHALVGDHDVHEDPGATKFIQFVGDTYAASSLRGFCFIRLNTQEHRPLGLSEDQTYWFKREVDAALGRDERVVVFQHNYPFQIWEQFDGPGIDAWREVVQTRRITAIFTGHTHYGQAANDGRNVAITTRSIGDPEGGPPGYTLAYLQGEDMAIMYRTIEDAGPVVLITHPRETLLATGRQHIVSQREYVSVHTWSIESVASVRGRVDDGVWFDLLPLAPNCCNRWWHRLAGDELTKGEHALEVEAVDAQGRKGGQRLGFMADNTGRYTPVPMVRPVVTETKFC